jgi:hypothetical protein
VVEPDLSAVGVDIEPSPTTTELARKEEKQFELDRLREDHSHTLRARDQDLGAVGRFFGGRDNAVVYVVATLVLFSLLLVAILSAFDANIRASSLEVLKVILYAGVGFLTGKSVDQKSER